MEIAHHYLHGGVSDLFRMMVVRDSARNPPIITKSPICAPEPEGSPKRASERSRSVVCYKRAMMTA